MTTIQIIGLPGSGKTTAIKQYLRGTTSDIQYLDIRSFQGRCRDRSFRRAILQSEKIVIAESACGTSVASTIIELKPAVHTVYRQFYDRDQWLDPNYMSQLGTRMMPADYTIGTQAALVELLQKILEG